MNNVRTPSLQPKRTQIAAFGCHDVRAALILNKASSCNPLDYTVLAIPPYRFELLGKMRSKNIDFGFQVPTTGRVDNQPGSSQLTILKDFLNREHTMTDVPIRSLFPRSSQVSSPAKYQMAN